MSEEESRQLVLQSFNDSFSNLIGDFHRETNNLKRIIQDVSEENVGLQAEVADYKKNWVPTNVALWKQSMNQLERESKSHEMTVKQLQKAAEDAASWKRKYMQLLNSTATNENLGSSVGTLSHTIKDESVKLSLKVQQETSQETCHEVEVTKMNGVLDGIEERIRTPVPISTVSTNESSSTVPVELATPIFKQITIKGKEYLFGVGDNYVYEIAEGGLPGAKRYSKENGKYKKV